jgi:D-serine deaminase-like pyridoxal phosphate-dependent protein
MTCDNVHARMNAVVHFRVVDTGSMLKTRSGQMRLAQWERIHRVSMGDVSLPEETPYVIVDVAKLETNLSRMAHEASSLGVRLRPHIKTHKIPRIARRQVELGADGITVAKMSEAEIMASAGISDIFVAHPIVVGDKIRRGLELSKSVHLTVGVDSMAGAKTISQVAADEGRVMNVRLEIDTGLRRTGVPLEEALELAGRMNRLEGLRLSGIYTYRGAFLDSSATLDFERAGRDEGKVMSRLAKEMRDQGISLGDVSVGSTPTAKTAASGESVTEIRPGTYVFYDRMQVNLGICGFEDCAAVVVATVVSRPSEQLAIIDAGSKTFATDVQPNTQPLDMAGFGHVVGAPEVVLDRLWEEHGTLSLNGEQEGFQVGDKISIIPNHICSTINLHNSVYFRTDEDYLEEVEVPARGLLT